MIIRMMNGTWSWWHLYYWADLRLRLISEILSVYSTQVMRTFICEFLNRLIVFRSTSFLFEKVISVGSRGIKSISIWVLDFLMSLFIMRIRVFLSKLSSIYCRSIKRLIIRDILIVFDKHTSFRYTLGSISVKIFRSSVKRNISFLVFDSRDYLLPHLRFMSGIVLSILWVYIRVGLVWFGFWIEGWLLSGGGFFQVLIGFLSNYFW